MIMNVIMMKVFISKIMNSKYYIFQYFKIISYTSDICEYVGVFSLSLKARAHYYINKASSWDEIPFSSPRGTRQAKLTKYSH